MLKIISHLLWFRITALSDWFEKLAPLSQAITSKTKTNCDLLVCVFLRFVPPTVDVFALSFDWFNGLSVFFDQAE